MTEPSDAPDERTTATRPDPARERAAGRVARVAGGFLVVGVVVGLGFLAEHLWSDDALELPDQVGGLVARDSAERLAAVPEEDRERVRGDLQRRLDHNDEKMSAALDGAPAATRVYEGDDSGVVTVTAVRADLSPPLPDGFDNPEALGYDAPMWDLAEEDGVTCRLHRTNPEGESAEQVDAALCQRSGGELTVRVQSGGGEVDLGDLIDVTNELWEELT